MTDDVFHRHDYAAEIASDLLRPTVLKEHLRSGVFLSGIRRVGKTTFVRQDLIPALHEAGALVIYVDLWADRSKDPSVVLHEAVRASLAALENDSLSGLFVDHWQHQQLTQRGIIDIDARAAVVAASGLASARQFYKWSLYGQSRLLPTRGNRLRGFHLAHSRRRRLSGS